MEFTTHLVEEDLVGLGSHRPAWQQRAACRGMGPAMFFPESGVVGSEASTVCARCPVTRECFAYATEAAATGIWGGVPFRTRKNITRAALQISRAVRGLSNPQGSRVIESWEGDSEVRVVKAGVRTERRRWSQHWSQTRHNDLSQPIIVEETGAPR